MVMFVLLCVDVPHIFLAVFTLWFSVSILYLVLCFDFQLYAILFGVRFPTYHHQPNNWQLLIYPCRCVCGVHKTQGSHPIFSANAIIDELVASMK